MLSYIPCIFAIKSGCSMFSQNEKQARRLAFLFCGIQFYSSKFSLRRKPLYRGEIKYPSTAALPQIKFAK